MADIKTITITEKVPELIYDIQNKSHLIGRAREDGAGMDYKTVSNMQASDDDEKYQLKRTLTSSYAHLENVLAEYLKQAALSGTNMISDEIEREGELTLTLSMPGNFNPASVDSLSNGIHDFLVCKTLAEWFAITSPEESKGYAEQAASSMDIIHRSLYRRCRPKRPSSVK